MSPTKPSPNMFNGQNIASWKIVIMFDEQKEPFEKNYERWLLKSRYLRKWSRWLILILNKKSVYKPGGKGFSDPQNYSS